MWKSLAAAALLAFALDAGAREQPGDRTWTGLDTGLQIAFTLALAADWSTSRSTLQHREKNPLLGPHPSARAFDLAAAGAAVGHLVVAVILPKPWREMWQVGGIVVETTVAGNNMALGGRITLAF
jgi:hypothetical protein